jgi:type I restriction enzyme, S subunit
MRTKNNREDILDQLLVPEFEQPYIVPNNWIWIKLKLLIKNEKRNIEPKKFGEEIFELYSVPSYPENRPDYVSGEEIGSSKQLVSSNDILLCKINPRINRVWKVAPNGGMYRQLASTEWVAINENKGIYPDYLLYLLKSPYFRKLITSNVSGVGGSLTRARPKDVEMYPIAVPPLTEQIRIAQKVEKLLKRINYAKQLIEEAKETFELRRAAILNKAFRGELTRNLFGNRKNIAVINSNSLNEGEPYYIPEGWKWYKFKEIASVKSNLVKPDDYLQLPHIAPDNIEKKTGRLLDYVSVEEANVKSPKHYFCKGQIVYSKIRPYLSKVILAEFEGLCSADMYPIETKLNTKYLFWYMLSPFFLEKASTAGSRSVLPKINQKELGEILVPVPPPEEQNVIVKNIESLLNKEDEVRRLLNLEEQIENIKSSILSKAFRGELGTNDQNEESALELLKEILAEKVGK